VQWYEKAATQGNADAQYFLGSLYDRGEGVPQNYAQARQWFERAATQGNPFAQITLGLKYYLGEDGNTKDYVLSYMWCSLAVQGDAQVREDIVAQETLETLERTMTSQQLQEARRLARDWRAKKENTP
jgi:TPR repeat protein